MKYNIMLNKGVGFELMVRVIKVNYILIGGEVGGGGLIYFKLEYN